MLDRPPTPLKIKNARWLYSRYKSTVIQAFIDRRPAASHAFSTPSPLPPPRTPQAYPHPRRSVERSTRGALKRGRGFANTAGLRCQQCSQKSTRSRLPLCDRSGHFFSSPLNVRRVTGLPLALHLRKHVRANPVVTGPANPWLLFQCLFLVTTFSAARPHPPTS